MSSADARIMPNPLLADAGNVARRASVHVMLNRLDVTPEELRAADRLGIETRGSVQGRPVRSAPGWVGPDGLVDVTVVAERLGMPFVHDERHDLWALGPEAGDRALASAELPPIVLTDVDGQPFDLACSVARRC